MDETHRSADDAALAIDSTIAQVLPPDEQWSAQAAFRHSQLTMPNGSLGKLLVLGRRLAAIQRTDRPIADPGLVAVFAADHGVVESGASACPSAVTAQMVANYLVGGAAINVLSQRSGMALGVVDLGVKHPIPLADALPGLYRAPVRAGTANFLDEPAMTRDEALQAVATGIGLANHWIDQSGFMVIALGEMGIGNTTAASALTAFITGKPVDDLVGRGMGLDDDALARKREIVRAVVRRHRAISDPFEALGALGGLEILGLAGLAIGAAARRCAVLLDGFISSTAGLVAFALCPAVKGSLFAAHLGTEPGHKIVLEHLGLDPILNLDLRLGEGTGAALAFPILAASADILRNMATVDPAGISRSTVQ